MVPLGVYLKKMAFQFTHRIAKGHRFLFDIFDMKYIGKTENILLRNITNARKYMGDRIKLRRELIKDPAFLEANHDFLTELLQIDYFQDKDDVILGLCCGFLFGST
jgi:hypothetical protein